MDTKYLYIFKSRDGFYKIGISNNVESRLASIRTSNHDDVEIVIARRLNDAFNFEQELHRRYEHRISRKSGEWFKLNSDEVIDVCIEINQAEGEKPKIVNKLLEKSLQRYIDDHTEIKESLATIKGALYHSARKSSDILDSQPISTTPKIKIETKKKDDVLIKEAEEVVRTAGRASASLLQRKLSIGYARAARLIDKLEEKGIVGHQNGAMPREVINPFEKEYRFGKIIVSETQ